MRYVISTHFYNAVYNVEQRLEIKTNELQKLLKPVELLQYVQSLAKYLFLKIKTELKPPIMARY